MKVETKEGVYSTTVVPYEDDETTDIDLEIRIDYSSLPPLDSNDRNKTAASVVKVSY